MSFHFLFTIHDVSKSRFKTISRDFWLKISQEVPILVLIGPNIPLVQYGGYFWLLLNNVWQLKHLKVFNL